MQLVEDKFLIAHRDLKPNNLILSKEMTHYKIGDFGEATIIETPNKLINRQTVGSRPFMSPEIDFV